jgi:hypothetical protein
VTKADEKHAGSLGFAGTVWTLTVKGSGAAAVASPRLTTYRGTIIPVRASVVHIKVSFDYPINLSPALYKWSVTGEHLTLVKVRDYIPYRVAVLSGTWSRK